MVILPFEFTRVDLTRLSGPNAVNPKKDIFYVT
jgi:hypothetical protein